MTGRGIALATLAACLALPLPARAFDSPATTQSLPCRPTIACTADLVVPGAFELETGILARHFSDASRQTSFPFLAKLTAASWAQLQVGSNGYTAQGGPHPARYLDNLTFGAKLHLLDQTTMAPSVSVSFTASLPTVAQEGYVRADDLLMTGYVTKDVGRLHADLNLGLNRFGIDGTPATQEWVALALSTALISPFGVMLESYYFTDAGPLAGRDGGLLFAVSHSPAPWLVFDAGGDVGYFPGIRSFSAFVGATVVPFLLWKPEEPRVAR